MKMIDKIMMSMRDTGLMDGMSDEDADTIATAALESLRTPNSEMLAEGMDKYARYDDAEEDVNGIFVAMIDAALNE